MRLIVMTIEHQLPHVHSEQRHVKCLTCAYKHTAVMKGEAESEAYRVSAGIQHMYAMRQECDKSNMTPFHLRKHTTMIQSFKDKILHIMCEDANEYLHFIDSSELLSQQLLCAFDASDTRPVLCASTVINNLVHELNRVYLPKIGIACVRCTIHTYTGNKTTIERSDVHVMCFEQFMRQWLHQYYHNDMACQFFGMRTMQSHEAFAMQYNVAYGAFAVYRRIMDINLLTAAPYGTVTMGVKTFSNVLNAEPAICITYSMPSAHRLATQTQDKITTVVSVAKMASLSEHRRRTTTHYAIYLPLDLETAIYLRFSISQIAKTLLERLQVLDQAHVFTKDKMCPFRDIKLSIFFDRGVFNAHIAHIQLSDDMQANELRLELIDIYRNAHWMGLNIFHKDMSLIFPRILAHFTTPRGHEIKMQAARTAMMASNIIESIRILLDNTCQYVEKLQQERPHLYAACHANATATMDSDFALAHESLRLAFSMTHTSVHKYAERTLNCSNLSLYKYACMSILYYGDTECTQCTTLYARLVCEYAHVSNTLKCDYDVVLRRLSQLYSAEYTILCSQSTISTQSLFVCDKVRNTVLRFYSALSDSAKTHFISGRAFNAYCKQDRTKIKTDPHLTTMEDDTINDSDALLHALLNVQKDVCKHQVPQEYALRDDESIRDYLRRMSGQQECIQDTSTRQHRRAYIRALSKRKCCNTEREPVIKRMR